MSTNVIADRLIRKLESFAKLSAVERQALQDTSVTTSRFPAHTDLIQEGDPTDGVHLIIDGFACRYKLLADGRRQIVAFCVPGDLCDLRVFVLQRMDHAIGTLSPTHVARLSRDTVLELTERHPRLTRALWWATLVEEAITREWMINVGQRTAFERTAHLMCEVFLRLRAVGLVNENACEFPLTQTELADTLALSTVHVNRTLMDMRRTGLISLRDRQLIIHDLAALQDAASFNPGYLHLEPPLEIGPGHSRPADPTGNRE
ncbi:MAG TPA: Crp/Fnr family transcriptional regulator [Steroidobacteraceae bacterium]|jgi:CRP-like cAMP-binding protein|nr:Crp/Fnr family transcriptional regulator [Steroidobacteraceae bacterium]